MRICIRKLIYLYYGKICCPSVNMSMNKCHVYSAIRCDPFSDPSSVTCSLSYSSFADNNASAHICIRFYMAGAISEIKCCNILRNIEFSGSYGTISTEGNLTIEDSCILENSAVRIFYTSSSYIIILSNCTVDSMNHTNSLILQNTVTKSFILGLNHISTHNCHAEYDLVGHLTAFPYVSHHTNKEFCYTNKVNHCQGRISVLFSIIQVFIFTFIYLNPS
jgi:hypothetical protein